MGAALIGAERDEDWRKISLKEKAEFVIKTLIESKQTLSYVPLLDIEVELSVEPTSQFIDSVYPRVEPTNETLQSITHFGEPRVDPDTDEFTYPEITTFSTPSDGTRRISFVKNGQLDDFKYLNLFRMEGDNFEEITTNFLEKVDQKQAELSQVTGANTTLFEDYFVENPELIEPLIWKSSSVDQKLMEIIPKYTDRDSFMPTPFYNPAQSPENQPDGYEVLHIVAEGDAQGFEFGLNRAMLAQSGETDVEGELEALNTESEKEAEEKKQQNQNTPGNNPGSGNYVCGDPSGVEVWEWFDSVQCWIEEEILPANDLFALSQMCSAAPLPPQGTTVEDGADIFDQLLPKADGFEVNMSRTALLVGQEAQINVTAFDGNGNQMFGYIDTPVTFELSDPDLGVFSEAEAYIFSGQKLVTFRPEKAGSSTLTVRMADMPPKVFEITVHDSLGLQWSSVENITNGRSEFAVTVTVVDQNNNPVTGVNDQIVLSSELPADGGFVQEGRVSLVDGKGQSTFIPTPGRQTVTLMSKDLFIQGEKHVIEPSKMEASQLILRTADETVVVGEMVEIEVIAADEFGFIVDTFNEFIVADLTASSDPYATLQNPGVQMVNGRGTIVVNAGQDTSDIIVTAQHEDLKSAQISLALMARVDSETWASTYPQTLFASLVGFPAGKVMEEDYFGGVQLMGGKTQAVYSFLDSPSPEKTVSISPNHLIEVTDNGHDVLVEFAGPFMALQAFDQKKMQTLISKTVMLNFDAVEMLPDENLEKGKLYLEMLDSNYEAVENPLGYRISSVLGDDVVNLKKNGLQLLHPDFAWDYVLDPEFDAVELTLNDGTRNIARVILNLEDENLSVENFKEVNPNLQWHSTYSGSSTSGAKGLSFFDSEAEVEESQRAEFYGLEGEHDYLAAFASGTNVGEAVRFNLPTTGILLGDPTIKLETKSNNGLNFNNAVGQQIYEDPEGSQIVSINHFNFNNDEYQDVAALTEDGRVRLLEGGPTEPPFKDRGDIAKLADGGVALEAVDFENDGYEDLLIATEEGRLAILHNREEVMERTDQILNIGKKIYKLLMDDMDQDGFEDLVILDSRGDLFIFYYDAETERFPENGLLIENYGFSLQLDENLNTDVDIRYQNMPEPTDPQEQAQSQIQVSNVPLDEYEGGGEIDDEVALEFYEQLNEEAAAMAEDPYAYAQTGVPKLQWPEGDEIQTYFAPIEGIGGLNVTKSVSNKDRPGQGNVDVEEVLVYEIELNSVSDFGDTVLADTVPDALDFDPNSLTCVQGGCENMEVKLNGTRLFLSELSLFEDQKTIIRYETFVSQTPEADVSIQTIDEPNENLNDPGSIIDEYKDIIVSPPFNNTGQWLIHYSVAERDYDIVQSNTPEPVKPMEQVTGFNEMMAQMEALGGQELDVDDPPEPLKFPGMGEALEEATGNGECYEDPNDPTSCVEAALDDVAQAVEDFSCTGGGCFPMPFNRAFMVPPEMPYPVFAHPTSVPTTVGIQPLPSGFPILFPGAVRVENVEPPYQSFIRVYVAPTITGGIGIATCWGPYPESAVVPPPVFPIPYPPPTGNCMVKALPADDLYGGLCSDIEKGVDQIMDAISSGVTKIESAANSATNNPNIPVDIQPVGPQQGAGGLEVSLAINLGNNLKFEPPVNAYSNIHLKSFDSLGGVLANWVDRQMLEVQNKLLTLPTLSVYLPDTKNLVTLDFERTQQQFESWYNTMDGSAAETHQTMQAIGDQEYVTTIDGEDTFPQILRSGLQDVSGSRALQYRNAIESQASIYNLNALEGLYDVAQTMPMVELTEKPIEFTVPWLSTGEIQAYIVELQNWIIYYEQEYDRVKDMWEAISCQDLPDPENPDGRIENSVNCTGRYLADAFNANYDEVIESAKQNIAVLESYLAFPKELSNYKTQMAGYVGSVSCYMDIIAQMMAGHMATIQQEMITWAEMILTIQEIVKNIKELFDVFTAFETNCDTCTNERFANFGWWSLLGLVLPDIPVIQFPKIPDIVLDLSNIEVALDVELPVLNIRPEPIPLPPLPYVTLPDFPTVDIFLQLPPLPILPELPELPELPDLPPLPVVELPTLPSPPKLPDVGKAFDIILPLIEKILQTWCMIKKSLAPVPEMALNNQISLLTSRPAYLTPFDLLQVQMPNIALFDTGYNELRIETIVYLGIELDVFADPLETAAETWNAWIDEIPIAMEEGYRSYLELTEEQLQEVLQEADDFIDGTATAFENAYEEYVQGWLDKEVGDPLAEADQWARDKEAEWEEWAELNEINTVIDVTYSEWIEDVNNSYDWLRNVKDEDVNAFFDDNRDIIHALNYVMPKNFLMELADRDDAAEYLKEMIDFSADKLDQIDTLGPTVLNRLHACLLYYEDCRANEEKYFGSTQAKLQEVKEDIQIALTELPDNPSDGGFEEAPVLNQEEVLAQQILETPEGQDMVSMFNEIGAAIDEVNEAEWVEYTVLKERFGVPDYQIVLESPAIDKINEMKSELALHAEQLYMEAEATKTANLTDIAGVAPQELVPYELASFNTNEAGQEERVFTSAVEMPGLLDNNFEPLTEEKIVDVDLTPLDEAEYKGNDEQLNPVQNNAGCLADVCLPDPITQKPVPVISNIEFLATSETLFMPNGHIVYSDGTGLYLKRDLTLDDSEENTDNGTPQRFSIEELESRMRIGQVPRDAINMMQTSFTENGAATFNWEAPTHPDFYGYGIELEKVISGYDSDRQDLQMADTRILLLPVNEEGETPDVFVGGVKLEFGTLVTSLDNQQEAVERFGIKPNQTVINASEIHFPTVNDAKIDVSAYSAVYFDQLQGNGYEMQMENGFYHIRMTWFDALARLANYNQSEILAPQLVAGGFEPLDISQDDTVKVPIFTEKTINASDIFVDLGGNYTYYWHIDPENKNTEPQEGEKLIIPPQDELKNIPVSLIASQNLEDPSFEVFEKEFLIEVYAPDVNLSQTRLDEGLIAGDMTPEKVGEDLTNIPFSVFRKRNETWKNVGILHAENESKEPTLPPLSEEDDSYYTITANGDYEIEGFDVLDPSPIIIKDHQGNLIAEILTGNGKIDIFDDNYELVAVAATNETPTRIAVVFKSSQEIMANVYYISSTDEDVAIIQTALNAGNVNDVGTTVGDVEVNDQVVAEPIPAGAPSFAGGAAIFNQENEEVIAMVDKDGAIRLMQPGFDLKLKNAIPNEGNYIFQIMQGQTALFEVFIQADWNEMEIDMDTMMNSLETDFAAEAEAEQTQTPALPSVGDGTDGPQLPSNPFSDLNPGDEFYYEILELYDAEVLIGFDDGTFRSDQEITRAEFVKIALGVTNCFDCQYPTDPQIARYLTNPFPDVELSDWFFYCIWVAKELEMITGYGDGQFRPSQNISRAEASAVLIRQADIPLLTAPDNTFTDVEDYAWYKDYVYTAVEFGLIPEVDGVVNPDEKITRGEFAFMAATLKNFQQCRLVDEDDDGNPDWWEMDNNRDPLRPDAEETCPCIDNPNQQDSDGDGRRDVCDLDIDGDGALNPICVFDSGGDFSQALLEQAGPQLGEPVDNCLFTPNPDQADFDLNGVGDVCEVCPCLDNPNANDTDGDGTKDACDIDIDGDLVNNPMCIFDNSGLLDQSKLIDNEDNCIFDPNSNQLDTDNNGIGDVCQAQDLCPNIPEDLDGVNDVDGCPELSDDFPLKDPGVYVGPGPLCGLIDYKSDFMPGDVFMTAITDLETHSIIFSQSKELTYD